VLSAVISPIQISMGPVLTAGVDFKCTPQLCYGIGPIHNTIGTLQFWLNQIVPITRNNLITEEVRAAAIQAASMILGLGLPLDQEPSELLHALQAGQLSRRQIAEWTVALTQLFKLGIHTAAQRGSWI
jgi:hypothetical protein